ncbi:MAG: hypothetical protein DGJ47_001000 [Rickettsiaceae bacterium]
MLQKNNVSCGTSERLSLYVDLVKKWNAKINLVSINALNEFQMRHIDDSLQLLNYISINQSVIDLGSGGGLPGVVLSISGVRNVSLIESDERKASFLIQATNIIPNDCIMNVINERIEKLDGLSCDVITSRAFAELNKIFEYSRKIKVRDKYLLHKGENYQQEIDRASRDWLFNINIHDSLTSERGKILEIKNVRSK